jgi:hypothetical protein
VFTARYALSPYTKQLYVICCHGLVLRNQAVAFPSQQMEWLLTAVMIHRSGIRYFIYLFVYLFKIHNVSNGPVRRLACRLENHSVTMGQPEACCGKKYHTCTAVGQTGCNRNLSHLLPSSRGTVWTVYVDGQKRVDTGCTDLACDWNVCDSNMTHAWNFSALEFLSQGSVVHWG